MPINLLEVSTGNYVVISAICSAKLVPSEVVDSVEKVLVLATADGHEHRVSGEFHASVCAALFLDVE